MEREGLLKIGEPLDRKFFWDKHEGDWQNRGTGGEGEKYIQIYSQDHCKCHQESRPNTSQFAESQGGENAPE